MSRRSFFQLRKKKNVFLSSRGLHKCTIGLGCYVIIFTEDSIFTDAGQLYSSGRTNKKKTSSTRFKGMRTQSLRTEEGVNSVEKKNGPRIQSWGPPHVRGTVEASPTRTPKRLSAQFSRCAVGPLSGPTAPEPPESAATSMLLMVSLGEKGKWGYRVWETLTGFGVWLLKHFQYESLAKASFLKPLPFPVKLIPHVRLTWNVFCITDAFKGQLYNLG